MASTGPEGHVGTWILTAGAATARPAGPSSCSLLHSFCSQRVLRPLSPCRVHQPHTLPTSSPGNDVLGLLSKPWEYSLRWKSARGVGGGKRGREGRERKGTLAPLEPQEAPVAQILGREEGPDTGVPSFPREGKIWEELSAQFGVSKQGGGDESGALDARPPHLLRMFVQVSLGSFSGRLTREETKAL